MISEAPSIEQYIRDDFLISTDHSKLDLNVIHEFLTNSYWCPGISLATVEKFVRGSVCFGLFKLDQQIGFARLITDHCTFAYLADVFVLKPYQQLGLGKWLIETIVSSPSTQNLRRLLLFTDDTQGLYEKYGFRTLDGPTTCMQIYKPSAAVASANTRRQTANHKP